MRPDEIDQFVDDISEGMARVWDDFGWIKGTLGADQVGYCAIGAWRRATGTTADEETAPLTRTFRRSFLRSVDDLAYTARRKYNSVESFNDDPRITAEDVRLVTKHSFGHMKDDLAEMLGS